MAVPVESNTGWKVDESRFMRFVSLLIVALLCTILVILLNGARGRAGSENASPEVNIFHFTEF